MKIYFFGLLFVATFNAFAAVSPPTSTEAARFPHMTQFLSSIQSDEREPTPAGNAHLIKAKTVFHPSQALWNQFFSAAVADKLTNIRAFALIAEEMKKRGITVYGPGKDFENAVRENKIDLGLAIPAKNIGLGIWEPDPSVKDPEFLLHLSVIYTERFIHQFPDEVLPANLKIGYGDEVQYEMDGEKRKGYILTADLYSGPHGVGFKNVHGVAGQKRGVVGFFQKVLFFLPDAIHSMVIDEKKNEMLTEALINTRVENFETRDIYSIRHIN
jgi:hypothetical protein